MGVLEDYFYRVEFQQRGSLYIHMLVWINDSQTYSENDDEDVFDYIDRVSSCSADVPLESMEFLTFKNINILNPAEKEGNRYVDSEYHFHQCKRQW